MEATGPDREAVITGLRARIAALGGIGSPSARPARAVPSGNGDRARELGFFAEAGVHGVTFTRRVDIDLGPWLVRAGCPDLVEPHTTRWLSRPPDSVGGDAADAGPAGDPGDPGAPGTPRPSQSGRRAPVGPVVVLDIETLGLRGSGVVPFLVGVGMQQRHRLVIDQLLLVEPADERALLARVAEHVAKAEVLLSYNGRTFDLPVLGARCVVNRLDPRLVEPRAHCDVLAPVRRLFRDRLGACTLRHAEVGLLGFERVDDVPGHEAPARYRAWLRGAGSEVLAGVVEHNQLDLCSTAVVAARAAAHVQGRLVEPFHPGDRYNLGIHLERIGLADAAHDHLSHAFESSTLPWGRRAGHRLAARARRGLRSDEVAITIFRRLWDADRTDLCAARALAISLDRSGDIEGALRICREAAVTCERAAVRLRWFTGAPSHGWEEEWRRRSERLERRRGRISRSA